MGLMLDDMAALGQAHWMDHGLGVRRASHGGLGTRSRKSWTMGLV
jgi:hypothetical protein